MKKTAFFLALLFLLTASGCGASSAGGADSAGGSSAQTSAAASAAAGSSAASSSAASGEEALDLTGLLNKIRGAAPGTAGCSLKQVRAAGELLDWAQTKPAVDGTDVADWLSANGLSENADLAAAWAAVLDDADRILAGDDLSGELSDAGYTLGHSSYDSDAYHAAAKALSGLFTQLWKLPTTAYAQEAAGDYGAITLDALDGIWFDSQMQELLIFSNGKCRVVIPYLDEYGDTAYAARIRDRSAQGYCPALEINTHGNADFSGSLTYYVSGLDETHFWCNTQSQRFDRIQAG